MNIKKWFTLVEVVVVVMIMAIILSMTVFFSIKYLKDIQLRTEKEALLNTINYALSYVKSTNYYLWDRFSYIEVKLLSTGVTLSLDDQSLFSEYLDLQYATISLTGWNNIIHLFPYARACEDFISKQDIVSFALESNSNQDKFCFDRDMRLCKLFVVWCP